jgi:tetratricopeptide (TPR) repeat protein
MQSLRVVTLVAVVVLAPARIGSQEHVHRQGDKLGTVHFATSCAPTVASQFDRAVALLHSFEFGDAIKGFTDVLSGDSTCAMAYWGIAMSRWSNPMAAGNRSTPQLQAGRQAADAGVQLASRQTEREREYLAAVEQLYQDYEHVAQGVRVVNYEHAMADLAQRQPADTEAKIFYALALAASAPPSDKTYANQLKAGSILEPLLAKMPDHPGLAHYIIHTYDVPPLASRAEAAAEKYAEIAPSAAHAQHMPSHTFTRVGEWTESIAANRRSIAIALAAGCIGEVMHASDYSAYAYLQLGQDSAAAGIMRQLPALAARFDPTAICGAAPGSAGAFALAAIPTRFALERRDWASAAALALPASTTRFPWTAAMVYFGRALGAAHLHDFARAQSAIDSLGAIRDRLRAGGEPYWTQQVVIQTLGAQAWLELASGKADTALAHMQLAAAMEDSTEKNAVTPGPLAPARELLGDMLMQLGRPTDALREYKMALMKEPNRFRTLYGGLVAARAARQSEDEAWFGRQLETLTAHADTPGRPELSDIRARR